MKQRKMRADHRGKYSNMVPQMGGDEIYQVEAPQKKKKEWKKGKRRLNLKELEE